MYPYKQTRVFFLIAGSSDTNRNNDNEDISVYPLPVPYQVSTLLQYSVKKILSQVSVY